MTLNTFQALVFVFLFALALGGFLHAAWQRGEMNMKRGLFTIAFAALAAADAFIIVTHTPA